MRKLLLLSCLTISFSLYATFLLAQDRKNTVDTIKNDSRIWDVAFNKRDTNIYFRMVDTAISITAGGGTAVSLIKFKLITNRLYSNRPDIDMHFNIERAEINDRNNIGYDTGEWVEAWTEKNDVSKSEIRGKYWRMWKRQDSNWTIMAIVLTPLSCKGSYCNK